MPITREWFNIFAGWEADGVGERKGIPTHARIAPDGADRENGKMLWIKTEELVQLGQKIDF